MSRYSPAILGAVAIIGLTIPQILMSDRFADSNTIAEEQAELLENVPKEIGDWMGEDEEVAEEVRKTAGAVGAIQRLYRNKRTGDEVRLWLIVGHARPISAHTPDICYRGSGFIERNSKSSLHPFAFAGQREAPFWTNTFTKEDLSGRQFVRVFWSWYNPMDEDAKAGKVQWQAVENPRWLFGNTRALFKMYFTNQMRDPKETTEDSACSRFARDFLPVVNRALSQAPEKASQEVVEETTDTPSEEVSMETFGDEAEATETEPATRDEARATKERPKVEVPESEN